MPLELLAHRLEAWLTLPSMSRWLTHTIRLGYTIQFARRPPRRPPKCRWQSVPPVAERPCLARGDCCPPGPSSREEAGVLQPLLHRSQETWWPLTNPGSASFEPGFTHAPVQDAQAHYQMHPAPGLVCSDRPEGCLLSCFDPSMTQTVPTVCFRRSGMAVQGPPLWALPVSPCVHEGQRISFLGVELDSVSMTARLTEKRAQAVLNCLSTFRGRNLVPLKQFQRLRGHMASAAAVTPLGLLHMRPLQHWLHSRVPRWAWRRGTLRVGITQQCRRSLSPWMDLAFLRAGVPLYCSRHTVVTTDASSTGWGATCNGQAASGLWTGPDCFDTSTA